MLMLLLVQIELLKTKRSLALLMLFVCPLFVVVLQSLIMVKTGGSTIDEKGWAMLWAGANAIWCYFMLPLYIALITALLNGNEHKNATWRLMLSLPVQPIWLYLSKLTLAWLYTLIANLVLFLWVAVSILLLKAFGYGAESFTFANALDYPFISQVSKTAISCLPILIIQHAISWRYGNIVAPLALGVIATMGISQIGSSDYWVYYPWSYMTMSNMGSDSSMQLQAVWLALGTAVFAIIATSIWLCRRETSV